MGDGDRTREGRRRRRRERSLATARERRPWYLQARLVLLELHRQLGAFLRRLRHDHVDGVLRQSLHRHAALLRIILEIDGDGAQAVHQRVLDHPVEDPETVVLAHEDVRHVGARVLGPLLLAGRAGGELGHVVGRREHPHQAGHDRFDYVGEFRGHDLRGAVLLVAIGLTVVVVERILACPAERRPLVVAGGILLLAQDGEQITVGQEVHHSISACLRSERRSARSIGTGKRAPFAILDAAILVTARSGATLRRVEGVRFPLVRLLDVEWP